VHSVLYVLSVLCCMIGAALLGMAKSVMHEQLAGIVFGIGAIFFCTAAVIQVLERISQRLDDDD
jgi:Na+/phosphate symporter